MKEYKSVKEQLLDYYMAQDHTPYTNTVIKVLSLTDPEIETTPQEKEFEDINIVVAIPKEENLRVDIHDPSEFEAESSAQGQSRNPPSGTTYDRPRQSRPSRQHSASYQSGPLGGSYQSGRTYGYKRFRVPEDYRPDKSFDFFDVLNIDCLPNEARKILIEGWHNNMVLIIQTDDHLRDDFTLAHTLMLRKSVGLAHKLIEGLDKDQFMRGTCEDFLQNVVNLLYSVFIGINYLTDSANQVRIEQENSRLRLTRLQICDLCELDSFTCDYEKHLFNLPNQEWVKFIEDYLRKIPHIGPMVIKEYQALPPINQLSLAVAKNLVKEKLEKICTDRMLAKKTKKINLCCSEFLGPETMYGCETIPKLRKWKKKLKKKYRFSKPRRKQYYKSSKRFRKYYSQPKYRKRFFKKHKPRNTKALNDEPQSVQTKDKAKYCPQKKKDCKCWICQEVGHYSYECPNTKNNKAQARVLEEIMELEHLAPIEDMLSDISSDEELYLLESDTEGDFELSEDDYSTTSDSEDQE
jgi:hypothetical protein